MRPDAGGMDRFRILQLKARLLYFVNLISGLPAADLADGGIRLAQRDADREFTGPVQLGFCISSLTHIHMEGGLEVFLCGQLYHSRGWRTIAAGIRLDGVRPPELFFR